MEKWKGLFLVIFCSAQGVLSQDRQSRSIDVVAKYSKDQFNKQIPLSNHLVLFYAPWSGNSKNVAATLEEFALQEREKQTKDLTIVKVDCTSETELCGYQDISNYPTLKLYRVAADSLGQIYRGIMDIPSIEQFINRQLGREAERIYDARVGSIPEPKEGHFLLQDENFDEAINTVTYAVVKFCTPWSSKCMDLEPVWKKIAKQYRYEDDFMIGSVDCSMSKTTCNENEVRGYPSILFYNEGIMVEKYPSTKRDFDTLMEYIVKKTGKKEVRTLPKDFEDEDESEVTELTKDTIHSAIASTPLLFVQFWTAWCSECMRIDPMWETYAVTYNPEEPGAKPEITIAKFDCVLNKNICTELGVKDFPTLNLYRNGKLEETYKGRLELEDMHKYIKQAISKKVEL